VTRNARRLPQASGPRRRRQTISQTATMKLAQGAIVKPTIPQESEPKWYILNVANGKEMHAKKLLDMHLEKAGLTSEVLDVVVPTLATSVTRGKRVSPHLKALFPSYTFVYMVMGPKAHSFLCNAEYVINFIGRDSGVVNGGGSGLTGARGFVTPMPLSDADVEGFQLRTEVAMKLDDPTLGFTIGEIVEVTEGNYVGERGPVRLVRNGCVNIRLYAYGQTFDLDFNPKVVRKLFEDDFVQALRDTEEANTPAQTPKAAPKKKEKPKGAGGTQRILHQQPGTNIYLHETDGVDGVNGYSSGEEEEQDEDVLEAAAEASALKAKAAAAEVENRKAKQGKWKARQAKLEAMNPNKDASSPSSYSSTSRFDTYSSTSSRFEDGGRSSSRSDSDSRTGSGNDSASRGDSRNAIINKEEDIEASMFGLFAGGPYSYENDPNLGGDQGAKEAVAELATKEASFLDDLFSGVLDEQVETATTTTTTSRSGVGGGDTSRTSVSSPFSSSSSSSSLAVAEVEGMTVPELKSMCRDLGLKVGGTKAVLQGRIQEATSMAAAAGAPP